jgi:hypothetical protein
MCKPQAVNYQEVTMNRVDVKVLMMKEGVTVANLARRLEVSSQVIYDVMATRRTSKRIETALEETFKMPIANLRAAWRNENLSDSETRAKLLPKLTPAIAGQRGA